MSEQVTEWSDHEGNIMKAPASDRPTGFGRFDRLTHRIMAAEPGYVVQAISWCGRRVHEVPGRGDVDCPECLERIAEAEQRPDA